MSSARAASKQSARNEMTISIMMRLRMKVMVGAKREMGRE
jgi:hypothetical protein